MELQKIPQGPLSEDEVKHIALSCLKAFYKYHPRKGQTEARLNQRAEGDIIADGYLSFEQEDGSIFSATFEATSLLKRDEVLFRVQKELLAWDSLTASSFICLILMIWEHLFVNNYWIPRYGWYASVALVALFIPILAFFLAIFLKSLRRYRYIYAIEQFKQYHTNDQWIVLSGRIFPDKSDKYYEELKQQCVYNGVGLIEINEKREPRIKIDPARNDLFKKEKRKMLQFSSSEELAKRIESKNESRTGLMKYLPKPQITFEPEKLKLTRFKRFYGYQLMISIICLVLLFTILFREYEKEKTYEVVDAADYREEMANLILYPYPFYGPDTIDILDTPYVRSIPFNKNVIAYDLEESTFAQPGLIVYSAEGLFVEYACERIYDIYKRKYAIDAGRYKSLDRARQVMGRLNRRGVSASILWMGCFNEESEYLLFIGQLYVTEVGAEVDIDVARRRVIQLGYVPELSISEINY